MMNSRSTISMDGKSSTIKEMAEKSSRTAHKVQIANKLIDTMIGLQENFEQNQRRWIWELIQNAKDVSHNGQVKIKITLNNDRLEFAHTGQPFKTENLVYLIEQTSSKERSENENEGNFEDSKMEEEKGHKLLNEPKNTGKFGTGFITTHLLSRKVTVHGVWTDEMRKGGKKRRFYKKFVLSLDRSARTQSEMIKNIECSNKVFEQLDQSEDFIENYKAGVKYNTKFRYELDERGVEVAKRGLDDLQESALLTMIFNPEIISLRVIDNTRKLKRKYCVSDSPDAEKGLALKDDKGKKFMVKHLVYSILESIEGKPETETQRVYVTATSNNEEEEENYGIVAVELAKADQKQYRLVKKPPKAPVIYADFPLIGTENFPFPCYINSHLFKPNEPRSGLLVTGKFNEAKINRAIFSCYIREYCEILLEYLSHPRPKFDQIIDLHLLVNTGLPPNFEEDFYRRKIQIPLRNKIFSLPLIENVEEKYCCFINCMIPHAQVEYVLDLHDLIKPIFNSRLIKKDLGYLLYWQNEFTQEWEKTCNVKNLFSIYDVISFVDGKKEMEEILERLELEDESEVCAWLNNIYTYLHNVIPEAECNKILNTFSVIPNQKKKLCKLDDLSEDGGIPEVLKDIMFNFGVDIRETLIDMNIIIPAKSTIDIHAVIKEIENFLSKEGIDPELKLQNCIIVLSILPKRTKDNNHIVVAREKFLDIILIIFQQSFPRQEILDVNYVIFEKAETFAVQTILKLFEGKKTIQLLSQHLGFDSKKTLSLLSDFFQICLDRNWRHFIKDRRIFPNQLGEMKLAKELLIDKIEKDLGCGYEEEEVKYGENDMRSSFAPSIEKKERKADWDKALEGINDLYRRVTKQENLMEKLLDKSLNNLEKSGIFTETLGMNEVSKKLEAYLKEKRALISTDEVVKAIIKNLYTLTRLLEPVMRSRFFDWFEQNAHSLMSETVSDEPTKKLILELAVYGSGPNGPLLKRMTRNELTLDDLMALAQRCKIKMPMMNPPLDASIFDMDRSLLDQKEDFQTIFERFNDPEQMKSNLVDFNITSDEQLHSMIEKKHIKMPLNFKPPSQDTFQYVLRVLDMARKKTMEHLKQLPNYNLSDAHFDLESPNRNILVNVRKNNQLIHIVVRPGVGNKIIIHNETEVKELENPDNELWYSDGVKVTQLTLGQIFRASDMRVIRF